MNEWVWRIGGMILTGATLGEGGNYTAGVVDELTSIEHWWNDTGGTEELEENFSQRRWWMKE
jgi:hypothetical protein